MESFLHPGIQRQVPVVVSDRINDRNVNDIAKWCNGFVLVPLFEELGKQIEFMDRTGQVQYASKGNRIVQYDGKFFVLVETEDRFHDQYELIEAPADEHS